MPEIKKYLNRDGLDEYNSLLPHSSAEMQTYVNDWLDEHPEATTTVQDGAITEPKLADKSVSLRTLADDTVHMLKGAILTGNLSGNVLTADDAYSAPPMALTVDGKSTQDGTPTPESPVEIVSLEQVNLTFAGKNLCGGTALRDAILAANPNAITGTDANGSYVTNPASTLMSGKTVLARPFKRNTVYTIVIAGKTSSASAHAPNMAVRYTDGSYSFIRDITPNYEVITTVTTAGKTVRDIYCSWAGGTDYYYYDSCGVFEGVVTESDFIPYEGTSVLLNLTHALRSLPDGTHDALSFAYLRPSTREGWAWYDVQRVVRVGRAILDGSESWTRGADAVIRMYTPRNDMLRATNYQQRLLCTTLHVYPYYNSVGSGVTGISGWSGGRYPGQNWFYVAVDGITTAEAMKQWFSDNPTEVLYELVTPTVTNLDPIELPFTAAPNFTIWNEPSTNLQIEYVRNANIVIQNIEQAIADQ